ncbi:hypothetical protein HNQ50_003754 [Silvimonas terrae]|uniref:Uncharacterized protein n=1 Tax=Silvimonas terrae TaxID=300266 RepID=A0A840RKK4_9NEIS|nr:hypothetical protein [Silvimonas terrae]
MIPCVKMTEIHRLSDGLDSKKPGISPGFLTDHHPHIQWAQSQ